MQFRMTNAELRVFIHSFFSQNLCGEKCASVKEKLGKKRGVSYFYRTATTSYLCYVPVLEELEGAGRKRLTPAQN